jgi:hypothetical protein
VKPKEVSKPVVNRKQYNDTISAKSGKVTVEMDREGNVSFYGSCGGHETIMSWDVRDAYDAFLVVIEAAQESRRT